MQILLNMNLHLTIVSSLQGITADPVAEDNYFEWNATVCGLHGTDWEGEKKFSTFSK